MQVCISLCHRTVFKFKQICRTIVIIVVYLSAKPILLENKILCSLFIGVLHICNMYMGKF